MEYKKYDLAKCYIIYRYTRALVRKSNTTDESILGVIKNKNSNITNNSFSAISIRDLIVKEVSRDLTKRILLPEDVSKAHEEGSLYFYGNEYFVQPIFNSSIINIEEMLKNPDVGNVKGKKPDGILEAVLITSEIIFNASLYQYGGITIDLSSLGRYLKDSHLKYEDMYRKQNLSKEKISDLIKINVNSELEIAIKTLCFNINTVPSIDCTFPKTNIFINIEEKEYLEENILIAQELFKQKYENNFNNPKITYVLNDLTDINTGIYKNITEMAIKCSLKTDDINYVSEQVMKKLYNGQVIPILYNNEILPLYKKDKEYLFTGRFNQGIVSLNLTQIGLISLDNEKLFWSLLDERLDLCKEALMCKYYALLSTTSNASPIHYKNGAISKLEDNEKLDKLLNNGYSTLALSFVGMAEMVKLVKKVSNSDPSGKEFALDVVKHIKERLDFFSKQYQVSFTLYVGNDNKASQYFIKKDLERYGIIKEITDKKSYTEGYYIDNSENRDAYEMLNYDDSFVKYASGGAISYIDVTNMPVEDIKDLVKFLKENVLCSKLIIKK